MELVFLLYVCCTLCTYDIYNKINNKNHQSWQAAVLKNYYNSSLEYNKLIWAHFI